MEELRAQEWIFEQHQEGYVGALQEGFGLHGGWLDGGLAGSGAAFEGVC